MHDFPINNSTLIWLLRICEMQTSCARILKATSIENYCSVAEEAAEIQIYTVSYARRPNYDELINSCMYYNYVTVASQTFSGVRRGVLGDSTAIG